MPKCHNCGSELTMYEYGDWGVCNVCDPPFIWSMFIPPAIACGEHGKDAASHNAIIKLGARVSMASREK